MPRRRKTPEKKNLATLGREVIQQEKEENLVAVSGFEIDEPVQYYHEGWRFGHIRELPSRGKHGGHARVEHSVTGKKVWVGGTGLKKLSA